MAAVDLVDREALRAAFAATTAKRPAHRTAFDTLFDLWWPPAVGEATAASGLTDGDGAARDELARLLLDGDPEALRRFALAAVAGFGQADIQPGRQSYFAYRVLRQLSPDTLVTRLLDALLAGADRGGLAETVARETLRERIRQFEEMVETEVRRRVAEQRGAQRVAQTTVRPLVEQVDFLRATSDDLAALRREVYPLARRLATRLTARRRLGRAGRLDFRRTVRASLASGGVPLETKHRRHKPHKPELVLLCDVSGSVAAFAHFTLLLAFALREQFTKVRAFAFVDTCDEVTRFFAAGTDIVTTAARMASEAELVWFDGHSDYGHSFEAFAERFPDALGPKTSLLILGDARNNYRAPGSSTLRGLCRQVRHAYWLNPEPAAYWGSGDSATAPYAGIVDEMVECRNVAQLQEFISQLLPA